MQAGQTRPPTTVELGGPSAREEIPRGGPFDLFETSFVQAAEVAGGTRSHVLEVAGEPVELHFAGRELELLLLPAFSHLLESRPPPTATGRQDGSRPLKLLVWESSSSGVTLPYRPRPKDATAALGPPLASQVCSLYHEHGAGNIWGLSIFDPGGRAGGLWARDWREVPWWERAAPFRSIWQWSFTSENRSLAHAAAIGTSAGGLLLVGRGGSGKSTTAAAAAVSGMRLAGDDYVVVESSPGRVVAHSLYATTKLVPETAQLLPELATLLGRSHALDGEKLVVSLDTIRQEALCRQLDIRAVVIPQVSSLPLELSTASSAEALRALAPSTVFQHFVGGAAAFPPLARALRQLPCYRMSLGPDPREAVALLASLLERSEL